MAEVPNTVPISFLVGGPKVVTKTIIVEYTVGSYEGPEPPSDGIYEKNMPGIPFPDPGTTPSGGTYALAGLCAQLFRYSDNPNTEDYDLFVYDINKETKSYSMRVQRTDEAAAWDDQLQSYVVFYFSGE